MDNPAKLSHVEASIERPLTPDEKRVIPTWLDQAWRILNRAVPAITARNNLPLANPDYLPAEDVRDVVVAMVERKVRNPDARRNWGGDDFSETVDAAVSSGQLYVSEAEKTLLMPAIAAIGGIFSIPLEAR